MEENCKKAQLTEEDHYTLKKYCKKKGVSFYFRI